ncbi:MAG: hypothetical protein JO320_25500 [Alphaproteobacteria bacterium]|nr:hypothetical protein [Alphaproteobacteria bacterium]
MRRARRIIRQATALAGILAILVQALLFAGHHHPLSYSSQAARNATSLSAPSAPAQPVSEDHDCQICLTLGHQGIVPVDFFTTAPPQRAPLRHTDIAVIDTPRAPFLLFRSRAPPVA